jgi:hypothetical protein
MNLAPDFLGGSLFIGICLNHARDEVAIEVAVTFHAAFIKYPELRIGIINGFINFLKNTPHQDDISICSVILVLASLIKEWVTEIVLGSVIDINQEAFYRVSCKLDAIMLIFMARPSNRIREMCIDILSDFYQIQQTFSKHGLGKGEMPLVALLLKHETPIRKKALFAFLEKSAKGYIMTASNATGMILSSFYDVARSQFSSLFLYYLGELAMLFAEFGRAKATRHCAKFLRALAIPYIGQRIQENSPEHVLPYYGSMILLMAMSGIPVIATDSRSLLVPSRAQHAILMPSLFCWETLKTHYHRHL